MPMECEGDRGARGVSRLSSEAERTACTDEMLARGGSMAFALAGMSAGGKSWTRLCQTPMRWQQRFMLQR